MPSANSKIKRIFSRIKKFRFSWFHEILISKGAFPTNKPLMARYFIRTMHIAVEHDSWNPKLNNDEDLEEWFWKALLLPLVTRVLLLRPLLLLNFKSRSLCNTQTANYKKIRYWNVMGLQGLLIVLKRFLYFYVMFQFYVT